MNIYEKHAIDKKFYSQLEKLKEIFQDSNNSIAIFHDNDCDGVLSYLILQNTYLDSIKWSYFVSKELDSQTIAKDNFEKVFKKKKFTHIVFLDTPRVHHSIIDELREFSIPIYILDHHVITDYMKELIDSSKITYLNPIVNDKDDTRPISFWSYILSDENESQFLFSLIGTISDFYITTLFLDVDIENSGIQTLFKPFDFKKIETIKKNYSNDLKYYTINRDENSELITEISYNTNIGVLKQFYDFIFKNSKTSQESINEIKRLSPFEVLGRINSSNTTPYQDFNLYFKKCEKFLKKAYQDFEKQDNKRIFLTFHKGRTSYNRQISEKARFELDVDISCSLHQKYVRDSISGSFRSAPHINLHPILEDLFKNINGNWGGHENSCGFQIDEKDKKKFMGQLLNLHLE